MENRIKKFCKKWGIKEFSLFGSSLNEGFNKESDIDILFSFKDNMSYGFFELAEMKEELESMYGRKVDLISRRGVEKSKNNLRRDSILHNSKLLYEEG